MESFPSEVVVYLSLDGEKLGSRPHFRPTGATQISCCHRWVPEGFSGRSYGCLPLFLPNCPDRGLWKKGRRKGQLPSYSNFWLDETTQLTSSDFMFGTKSSLLGSDDTFSGQGDISAEMFQLEEVQLARLSTVEATHLYHNAKSNSPD